MAKLSTQRQSLYDLVPAKTVAGWGMGLIEERIRALPAKVVSEILVMSEDGYTEEVEEILAEPEFIAQKLAELKPRR